MRRLESKLKNWQENQLLSEDQARKILEFELARGGPNWAQFGVIAIGVVAVLTGIVSIIASNWGAISPATKLTGYFVIQFALAYAFWRVRNKDNAAREALLMASVLLVLGGIGLVGQIYHLESDGWQALAFWLLIVLPPVLLTRRRLLNDLWFVGLGGTTILWMLSAPSRFGIPGSSELLYLWRLLFGIGIAYTTLAVGLSRAPILPYRFTAAARRWGFIAVLLPVTVMANALWAAPIYGREQLPLHYLVWPWLGAVLAIAALFFARTERNERYLRYTAALIAASCAGFTFPLAVHIGEHEIIGSAVFIGVWALAAASAASVHEKRLFDLATLMISLRLIVIYFEVFGSLASTGIGLIITGFVIIGAVTMWNKVRKALGVKFEAEQ